MKKRRTLIISLLLVAAIALGVGYATVTAVTLDIDGRAEIQPDQADFIVKFTGVDPKDENLATGDISSDLLATISVFGLKGAGESTTVTYTITNDTTSLYKADLKDVTIVGGDTEYFLIEVENQDEVEAAELAPGDSMDVVVKVTLKQSSVNQASADIDIAIKADPVEIPQ